MTIETTAAKLRRLARTDGRKCAQNGTSVATAAWAATVAYKSQELRAEFLKGYHSVSAPERQIDVLNRIERL